MASSFFYQYGQVPYQQKTARRGAGRLPNTGMIAKPKHAAKVPPSPCNLAGKAQLLGMRADFSLFRERLAEACRARGRTASQVSHQVGLSPRRAITLSLTGPSAIDVWRLCQIAEVLDVSLDWLVGRSNVMDVAEAPAPRKRKDKRTT
jgi:hypothetical protein